MWVQGAQCSIFGDTIYEVCGLYYYDIASQQVTVLKSNARLLVSARLSERFIVWTELDDVGPNPSGSLFVFDGSEVQELPEAGGNDASISGPRVAFWRDEASSREIFVATHESVAPFPALAALVPALHPLSLALLSGGLFAAAAWARGRTRRSAR